MTGSESEKEQDDQPKDPETIQQRLKAKLVQANYLYEDKTADLEVRLQTFIDNITSNFFYNNMRREYRAWEKIMLSNSD